jgi:hemerythrin-like domain-containing protein
MGNSMPVGVSLPGHHSPEVGFEAPFEMLTACHERVERMLNLVSRLVLHLATTGWDMQAATAASDVMRYFDLAAPQHHLDEEIHVFPAVLTLQKGRLDLLVYRLKQEHIQMEKNWGHIREILDRVAHADEKRWTDLSRTDTVAIALFQKIYKNHIQEEEAYIYPAAIQALDRTQLDVMTRDMVRRRTSASDGR